MIFFRISFVISKSLEAEGSIRGGIGAGGTKERPCKHYNLYVGSPTHPGNAPRALTPAYVSASWVGREGQVQVTAAGGWW